MRTAAVAYFVLVPWLLVFAVARVAAFSQRPPDIVEASAAIAAGLLPFALGMGLWRGERWSRWIGIRSGVGIAGMAIVLPATHVSNALAGGGGALGRGVGGVDRDDRRGCDRRLRGVEALLEGVARLRGRRGRNLTLAQRSRRTHTVCAGIVARSTPAATSPTSASAISSCAAAHGTATAIAASARA